MAAIIETFAIYNGGTAVTHDITLPSGIQNGDKLIALIGTGSGENALDNPTLAGFTDFAGNTIHGLGTGDGASQSGNSVGIMAWERDADGTEGSTALLTLSDINDDDQVSSVVLRISGHASGTPSIADDTTGTSTSANPPSLNTGASDEYLWLACVGIDSGQSITGFPTNYTEVDTATDPSQITTSVVERTLTAQTEDPGAFSHSNDQWGAITIAVAPGAAPAAGSPPFLTLLGVGT